MAEEVGLTCRVISDMRNSIAEFPHLDNGRKCRRARTSQYRNHQHSAPGAHLELPYDRSRQKGEVEVQRGRKGRASIREADVDLGVHAGAAGWGKIPLVWHRVAL